MTSIQYDTKFENLKEYIRTRYVEGRVKSRANIIILDSNIVMQYILTKGETEVKEKMTLLREKHTFVVPDFIYLEMEKLLDGKGFEAEFDIWKEHYDLVKIYNTPYMHTKATEDLLPLLPGPYRDSIYAYFKINSMSLNDMRLIVFGINMSHADFLATLLSNDTHIAQKRFNPNTRHYLHNKDLQIAINNAANKMGLKRYLRLRSTLNVLGAKQYSREDNAQGISPPNTDKGQEARGTEEREKPAGSLHIVHEQGDPEA